MTDYAKLYYSKKNNVKKFEQNRFYGEFGAYLRTFDILFFVHNKIVASSDIKSTIDVGAGTGRLTQELCEFYSDSKITAFDFSKEMLTEFAGKCSNLKNKPDLVIGNAQDISYEDQKFDMVISSRLLMHVTDWELTLNELCRISGKYLLFDFPPTSSIGAVGHGVLAKLLKKDNNFEAYKKINLSKAVQVLRQNNFIVKHIERPFVLPLPVHLKLNNLKTSKMIELMFKCFKMDKFFGAPVYIAAERIKGMS